MVDLGWFSMKDARGFRTLVNSTVIEDMILDGLSVEVSGGPDLSFVFRRKDSAPRYRGYRWPADEEWSKRYWKEIHRTVVVEMRDFETEECEDLTLERAMRILSLLDQSSDTPSIPVIVEFNDHPHRLMVTDAIYDPGDFRDRVKEGA